MRTFRLFISSTFSDFKKERQLLQLKVFPEIKKYCLSKGYKFQPIDLRWGISNEAQLDQKTLELCLHEVRACKSHPYPNFLFMIGDRYGWVPLPYMIEKLEFENLSNTMNDEEKRLVLEWYREDLNQLPASYILQSRSNEFVACDLWQEVENKLRIILQNAVKVANLSEEQSRKYYLSATEAEVEEGIIPYHCYTEYQKQLISENPSIDEIDPNCIFGFLRDSDVKLSDVSVNDSINSQKFKNRVTAVLPSSNIFHKQIHDIADESYLAEFEERVIAFLKAQIDRYEDNTQSDHLQQEIEAQAYFAQQKRKNFLAQEAVLETIASYIADTNKEPLIIYGPSGRGKSSIMAKAIEAAEISYKNVYYRFVGATPNSALSKEVIISIFDQLGINIRSHNESYIGKDIFTSERTQETFEEFSYRVYNTINALKENIIIFIDAVDQLVNEDQFLWLPSELPENVKIIISALNDAKYVEDSQYFKVLKNKTNNLLEIPVFFEPIKLLRTILNSENRTLQLHQEAYFLKQFYKVQSPLYVIVAAQELKNWKSYDTDLSLADTQQGIIQEFLENLSTIYHHNGEFVQKILGYIYASRDGLSEDELLQLISTDREFVKQIAPEHFHTNETGDLPLVIWTRLYTQLKPFLSTKYQDREDLLYFFHREFEDIVRSQPNQLKEHEAIIQSLQNLIKKYSMESFDSSRFGILYSILVTYYNLNYNDFSNAVTYGTFIYDIKHFNIEWVSTYLNNVIGHVSDYRDVNKPTLAKLYLEHASVIYNLLCKDDVFSWVYAYVLNLNMLTEILLDLQMSSEAKTIQELAISFSDQIYKSSADLIHTKLHAMTLRNLSKVYSEIHDMPKAIEYLKLAMELNEKADDINNLAIYFSKMKDYLTAISLLKELLHNTNHIHFSVYNNLAQIYLEQNKPKEARFYQQKALETIEKEYLINRTSNLYSYIQMMKNFATCLYYEGNYKEGLKVINKAHELIQPEVITEPLYWSEIFLGILENIAEFYWKLDDSDQALKYQFDSYKLSKENYVNNSEKWLLQYARSIEKLGKYYRHFTRTNEIIDLEIEVLKALEKAYKLDSVYWAEKYTTMMNNLIHSYLLTHQLDKAKKFLDKLLPIQERLYMNDQTTWIEDYISVLRNMASYHFMVQDKKHGNKVMHSAFDLTRKQFEEDPIRWTDLFYSFSKDLTDGYQHVQDIHNATLIAKQTFESIRDIAYNKFNDYSIDLLSFLIKYLQFLIQKKQFQIVNEYIAEYQHLVQINNISDDKKYEKIRREWEIMIKNLEITINMATTSVVRRNDLCSCGSGKKYKKCCGKNRQ